MSIGSVMPSNYLIFCRPLLPPSIFPSIRVFSNESGLCIRWPKYWSFSFSISPSNEHPGLIFFRMDWLALLALQGTLKSLLQHHSSKASVLWPSAFFIVQLSHPYMTNGKTIALTILRFSILLPHPGSSLKAMSWEAGSQSHSSCCTKGETAAQSGEEFLQGHTAIWPQCREAGTQVF